MKQLDTGAWLEAKFQSYLKDIDCLSYKPVDFKSLNFLIANFPQLRSRIPVCPCDRMVVFQGKSYWFELKHVKGNLFPFSRLRHHQIGYLLKHHRQGKGGSFIVLGYQYPTNKRRLYIVPIIDMLSYLAETRKSLSIETVSKNYNEISSSSDLLKFLQISM